MVDTVVIDTSKGAQEDPKHIEAMIAAVDNAEASVTTVETPEPEGGDQRPEWLPEKFNSPEDLAKAYAELETKLGGAKSSEGGPEETPKTPDESTEEAKEVLADKGLSFDEFSQEFAQTGALTDDSYKKLEAAGIPKAVVDQYIAGQQAVAARMEAEVKGVVGGDEQFQELVAWALDNADPADVAAYNRAVDSGDLHQAKLALAGLHQRFQESRPNEPKLLQGTNGRVSADVYESVQQLQEDMRKPEYKNDPAFRKKVQDKLGRSDIL